MMYGCKLSKVDIRDYQISGKTTTNLPNTYEVPKLPNVKNQKSVNSCVAHATSSILEYYDMKDNSSHELSTNFIYGIQNKICGHDGEGMYLRDACKIVQEYGDPLEIECKGNTEVPEAWSIAETAFNTESVMKSANYFKIQSYFSCNSKDAIKNAIYKYGPVLGCVRWYHKYKTDKNGLLIPNMMGDAGYHAIMIYGWNEIGFLCQNSWGKSWGKDGRFILPYNVPVEEARALIDSSLDIDSSDIIIPKRGTLLDIIYKIINWILNRFHR